MNPLWGLKLQECNINPCAYWSSQKHESSLGIETFRVQDLMMKQEVPKSMNPLWGLKRFNNNRGEGIRCSQKHESSLGIETHPNRIERTVSRKFPKA